MKLRSLIVPSLLLTTLLAAQDVAKNDYKPSEVQTLKLQLAQKDAIIAKQAKDFADTNFNNAYSKLQAAGQQVIEDNKWPRDLLFNPDQLSFTERPKVEPKAK